jgi:hypothetical protein
MILGTVVPLYYVQIFEHQFFHKDDTCDWLCLKLLSLNENFGIVFYLYNCCNVYCISFFFIYVIGLFFILIFILMVDGTDCCFLSSGYLYHTWKSILTIFGRA